jgi:hypothetical protein
MLKEQNSSKSSRGSNSYSSKRKMSSQTWQQIRPKLTLLEIRLSTIRSHSKSQSQVVVTMMPSWMKISLATRSQSQTSKVTTSKKESSSFSLLA